ncbi:MAG TPA: transposase [Coriobacteriaceae bacterium]|nr:transposase [Coriobacteriaceae bacterium]
MAKSRVASEANIYHVMARGTGKQIIYESKNDRVVFLRMLRHAIKTHKAELYAWCLMQNHFHLLIHGNLEDLSQCMRELCGNYAQWFNKRAGRVGHLFQERYKSEPIDDEAYLLTVIRYIHENPKKADICATSHYEWSSYREYVNHAELCNTSYALDILGGVESFKEFHKQSHESLERIDRDEARQRIRLLSEDAVVQEAKRLLGDITLAQVKSLPKRERNALLHKLKLEGFTVRQIERLTGIGRSIVSRA